MMVLKKELFTVDYHCKSGKWTVFAIQKIHLCGQMLLYSVHGESLSSITWETVILKRERNINTLQTSNTLLMSQQSQSCLIHKIQSQTEEDIVPKCREVLPQSHKSKMVKTTASSQVSFKVLSLLDATRMSPQV